MIAGSWGGAGEEGTWTSSNGLCRL